MASDASAGTGRPSEPSRGVRRSRSSGFGVRDQTGSRNLFAPWQPEDTTNSGVVATGNFWGAPTGPGPNQPIKSAVRAGRPRRRSRRCDSTW